MPLVCGLEGQEGCKVAANILHGLDCTATDFDAVLCLERIVVSLHTTLFVVFQNTVGFF